MRDTAFTKNMETFKRANFYELRITKEKLYHKLLCKVSIIDGLFIKFKMN